MTEKTEKRTEQEKIEYAFYITGAALAALALILYSAWNTFLFPVPIFFVPCLFHKFTGIYCPGCGGTRALETLLKGDFIISFLYHPVVIYGAVIYLWFMVSQTIQKLSRNKIKIAMHYRHAYLWIALALTAINFLIKNGALFIYHQDILEMLNNFLLKCDLMNFLKCFVKFF